jgi:eukaryotic-like serine/threonine-protein kinase
VRAFFELVPEDAPRGMLTAGSGDTGTNTFRVPTGARGWTASGSARVHTGGGGPVDDLAKTGMPGATGAPTHMTAAPASGGSGTKIGIAVGAVALLAGAAVAYVNFGRPPATPTDAPATSAKTAASAATSAAPVNAGVVKTGCPDGAVYIAGGKMFMGARDLNDISKPPHEVTVSSFCLDKTEVTTKAYMACVGKGECERPPETVSWPKITEKDKKLYSPLCNAAAADRQDHPINCVAWQMASTYCGKHDARLPT